MLNLKTTRQETIQLYSARGLVFVVNRDNHASKLLILYPSFRQFLELRLPGWTEQQRQMLADRLDTLLQRGLDLRETSAQMFESEQCPALKEVLIGLYSCLPDSLNEPFNFNQFRVLRDAVQAHASSRDQFYCCQKE